jgi:hypothetical protein
MFLGIKLFVGFDGSLKILNSGSQLRKKNESSGEEPTEFLLRRKVRNQN